MPTLISAFLLSLRQPRPARRPARRAARMGPFRCTGLLLGALLLVSAPARAGESFGPYAATVVRVLDGDTLELDVALWPGLTQRIRLRLDGINTAETRGRERPLCEIVDARRAKDFVLGFVRRADTVVVSGVRLGKFAGRVLGHVAVGGQDLGAALLAAGLAKPYAGGKRGPWCG